MEFTTEEVARAIKEATREDGGGWTVDDFGDELNSLSVQTFAEYVMEHFGKDVMNHLITNKASEISQDLARTEREKVQM